MDNRTTVLGNRERLVAMRFAALLRGVNVGRGNRVAMADLRAAVATCGYTDVGTVLASGNVVFTAPSNTKSEAIAPRLEKALVDELSLRVRVTVVDAATLTAVIKSAPQLPAGADGSRLLGDGITTRNRNTLLKLQAALAPAGGKR